MVSGRFLWTAGLQKLHNFLFAYQWCIPSELLTVRQESLSVAPRRREQRESSLYPLELKEVESDKKAAPFYVNAHDAATVSKDRLSSVSIAKTSSSTCAGADVAVVGPAASCASRPGKPAARFASGDSEGVPGPSTLGAAAAAAAQPVVQRKPSLSAAAKLHEFSAGGTLTTTAGSESISAGGGGVSARSANSVGGVTCGVNESYAQEKEDVFPLVYLKQSPIKRLIQAAKQSWDIATASAWLRMYEGNNYNDHRDSNEQKEENLVVLPLSPALARNNWVGEFDQARRHCRFLQLPTAADTDLSFISPAESIGDTLKLPVLEHDVSNQCRGRRRRRDVREHRCPVWSLDDLESSFQATDIPRRSVVEWMNRVVIEFGWQRASFFVGTHALDLFVSLERKEFDTEDSNFIGNTSKEKLRLPVVSVASLLLGALLVEDHTAIHRLRQFTRAVPGVSSGEQICGQQWDLLARLPDGVTVSRTPQDLLYEALGRLLYAEEAQRIRETSTRPIDNWLPEVVDGVLVITTAAYEDGCYALFTVTKLVAAALTPLLAQRMSPALSWDVDLLEIIARVVFRFEHVLDLHAALYFGIPLLERAMDSGSSDAGASACAAAANRAALLVLQQWQASPNAQHAKLQLGSAGLLS